MPEDHAIGIVLPHRVGQGGVKVDPVDLMVGGAEALAIVGAGGPEFQYLAGFEMAGGQRLARAGFPGDALADTQEVERMHGIGRDDNAGADLAQFARLLEHSRAKSETLQGEGGTQAADAAPDDRYAREFHAASP